MLAKCFGILSTLPSFVTQVYAFSFLDVLKTPLVNTSFATVFAQADE